VRTLYEGTDLPPDEDRNVPQTGIPHGNDSRSPLGDIGVVFATPPAAPAESLTPLADVSPSVPTRAANVAEAVARLDRLFSADTASTTPVLTRREARDAVFAELANPLTDTLSLDLAP
jgi:hypothetical protein